MYVKSFSKFVQFFQILKLFRFENFTILKTHKCSKKNFFWNCKLFQKFLEWQTIKKKLRLDLKKEKWSCRDSNSWQGEFSTLGCSDLCLTPLSHHCLIRKSRNIWKTENFWKYQKIRKSRNFLYL